MDLQPILERRGQVEAFQRKHRIGLLTLVFTDIVGSTRLKQELGDAEGFDSIQRHHALVREVLRAHPEGEEISTAGDSFFLVFAKPSEAVKFALLLQSQLRQAAQQNGTPVFDRIGIHIGEVIIDENAASAKPKDLYGMQVDICARVMSAGAGDQILMTRSAFDNARQVLKGKTVTGLRDLAWLNHGAYAMHGVEEPLEICEVGEEGLARLRPPEDSTKVRRFVSAGRDAGADLGTSDASRRSGARWIAAAVVLLGAVVAGAVFLPRASSSPAVVERFGFEPIEGFIAGRSLIGQRGWVRGGWKGQMPSGGEGVATGLLEGSQQQAFIGGVVSTTQPAVHVGLSRAFARDKFNGDVVEITWKQVIRPSSSGAGNLFEWLFYNQSNQLLCGIILNDVTHKIMRRLADNSVALTQMGFKTGQSIDVKMRIDFKQNLWSATIDGAELPPLPIARDNRAGNLGGMALTWRSVPEQPNTGDNLLAFDDLVITTRK